MSEFINKLDKDQSTEGLQIDVSHLTKFFEDNYLIKTKESRSKSVEKELLKLNSEGKAEQLAYSIEEYLNNLDFELQNGQTCKITTLLSNYPSSFAEAIKAVKSGEGKSLNIACALLSLHSILQGKGRLGYDQSKTYAEQYICKDKVYSSTTEPSSVQTTQNTDKKVIIGVSKEQLLSDRLPSGMFDTVAENHPLKTFTTVQELQTYLIDQGYTLPRFGADGKRGKETEKVLQKYLSDYKESKSPTTLPEDTTSVSPNIIEDKDKNIPGDKQKPTDDTQDNETTRKQDNKITTTPNSTESLSENNNFEKEKATIVSKTLEIQELVSHKTPEDIQHYINALRNNKQENPFIVYMAIMGGLNHINDADRQSIIDNYYTILGKLQKERKEGAKFEDDISLIANFLHDNSTYYERPKDQKNIDESSSLLGLKNTSKNNKLQFDCSSYSFFVYCVMSDFGHNDIGIAENEAIKHGIFVRKNSSSGNLTPYDFSNIRKNGKSSGSKYSDGRDMKDNIPANISLLISEYNAPNASLSTTYFALLGSQYVGSNGNTYYEPTLYDDLAKSIEQSYDDLYNNKKIIITNENYQGAKDLLSIMTSEVHEKVGKKGNDYSEKIKKLADALRTYSKYNL